MSDEATAPSRQKHYAPAADGIDDQAWALVASLASLSQRRKIRRLRRLLGTPRVPAVRLKLGSAYAYSAIAHHLTDQTGAAMPTEQEIHYYVLRYWPVLDRLTLNFTPEHIEDHLRKIFGYPLVQERDHKNTLVWAAALLGVSAEEPVGELLRRLRPRVAADLAEFADRVRAIAEEE